MDLEFTINEQICRIKDKRQQVVDLSENYLVLSFTFSDDWASTGKFVLYPMNDGTVLRQGINNNKSVVPADVLTGDKFYFTVYGINNNERITTNLVKVNLLKSGYTPDAITPGEDELTPSVVEEIYLILDNKANISHTHIMEDITNLPELYTRQEIDTIIDNIQNNIKLEVEPIIINGETTPITVYVKKDGFPLPNETIYIYQEE